MKVYRGTTAGMGHGATTRPSTSWTNRVKVAETYAKHPNDSQRVSEPMVHVGMIDTDNVLELPEHMSGDDLAALAGIDMQGAERFPTHRIMDDPDISAAVAEKFDLVMYPETFTSESLTGPIQGPIYTYRPLKPGAIVNMRDVEL